MEQSDNDLCITKVKASGALPVPTLSGSKRKNEDSVSDFVFFVPQGRPGARKKEENYKKMNDFSDKFLAFFNDILHWPVEKDVPLDPNEHSFSFHFTENEYHARAFKYVFERGTINGCRLFSIPDSSTGCSQGAFKMHLEAHVLDLNFMDTRKTLLKVTLMKVLDAERLRNHATEFATRLVAYINQEKLATISLQAFVGEGDPTFQFSMPEADFNLGDDLTEYGRDFGVRCREEQMDEQGGCTTVCFGKPFLSKSVDEHMNDLIEYFHSSYTYGEEEESDENDFLYANP